MLFGSSSSVVASDVSEIFVTSVDFFVNMLIQNDKNLVNAFFLEELEAEVLTSGCG